MFENYITQNSKSLLLHEASEYTIFLFLECQIIFVVIWSQRATLAASQWSIWVFPTSRRPPACILAFLISIRLLLR